MTGISTGVGLFSGIDFVSLTDQLMSLQRRPVDRMEEQVTDLKAEQTAMDGLQISLLSLSTTLTDLGSDATFESFDTTNSDPAQLTVRANKSVSAGEYKLQTLSLANTHEMMSRGFANADSQTLGTGTLTIQTGGRLETETALDLLNGTTGVRRGSIAITDRSGTSAQIDLSDAYSIEDVVAAINADETIDVTASLENQGLVLTDTSGGGGTLSVSEVGTGNTAADLGLLGSAAADVLTGSDLFVLTEDSPLSQINDGNPIRLFEGAPDLLIATADGTDLEINLDEAISIGDVLDTINNHEDNEGKVVATFTGGAFTLTDTTTGADAFTVVDNDGAEVTAALGLTGTAAGGVLTGTDLTGDLGSVSLSGLNGGSGVTVLGDLSLTDRAGVSTTVDLSGANSLADVVRAINSAEDAGTPLGLTARVDDLGTGIVIEDTTGATASNLIIADVGGATLAADLGIAIDAADIELATGSLNARYITGASSLTELTADGAPFDPGQIRITDSAGATTTLTLSSSVETVGDVIDRINAASGVQITARLNSTGDGFEIVDEAGGAGPLTIAEIDGSTAADLKILGEADSGVISSRAAAVIEIEAEDTLDSIVEKINAATTLATASVFETGASVNSSRLRFTANGSGTVNRLIIDSSGIDLGLFTQREAADGLLRLGDDPATSFLIHSDDNTIEGIAGGLDVTLREVSDSPATVAVEPDNDRLKSSLQELVSGYNKLINQTGELTKYDPGTEERGVLQGRSIVSRTLSRMNNLMTRTLSGTSGSSVRSLFDVGISIGAGGKLKFDEDRFDAALELDPGAVRGFFQADETGFADVAESVFDSLTDPFTGTYAVENRSLQSTIEAFDIRIEQYDEILAVRRTRMLEEFVRMETALATLNSQQSSLTQLANLVPKRT